MLQSLDLEPLKFTPYINNSQGYKTKFGGIKTILLIMLVILSIIAFGKELFLKSNPIVISSENYINYPIINKDQVNIAVAPHFLGGAQIKDMEKYIELYVQISKSQFFLI